MAQVLPGFLPEGSVVLARKPTLFWALSGYRARLYPFSDRSDEFFAAVDEAGARCVLVDQTPAATRSLLPILEAHPTRFCIAMEAIDGDAMLLQVSRGAALSPPGPSFPGPCRR